MSLVAGRAPSTLGHARRVLLGDANTSGVVGDLRSRCCAGRCEGRGSVGDVGGSRTLGLQHHRRFGWAGDTASDCGNQPLCDFDLRHRLCARAKRRLGWCSSRSSARRAHHLGGQGGLGVRLTCDLVRRFNSFRHELLIEASPRARACYSDRQSTACWSGCTRNTSPRTKRCRPTSWRGRPKARLIGIASRSHPRVSQRQVHRARARQGRILLPGLSRAPRAPDCRSGDIIWCVHALARRCRARQPPGGNAGSSARWQRTDRDRHRI